MALVTAPPESSRITAPAFARTHLYAALRRPTQCQKEENCFPRLAKDEWILFAPDLNPVVRDAIMKRHNVMAIARSTRTISLRPRSNSPGISARWGGNRDQACLTGLSVERCCYEAARGSIFVFETCLIMRGDEDSRLANEFGRTFLRRYAPRAYRQSKWNCGCQPEFSDCKRLELRATSANRALGKDRVDLLISICESYAGENRSSS